MPVGAGAPRWANWSRRFALSCVVCGALPAAALAAPAGKRGGESALLTVSSYRWVVSIDSKSQVASPGGKVEYCSTATIESLTPMLTLKSADKGVHIYGFELVGPKGAGTTGLSERSFRGRRMAVTTHFPPVAFGHLTAGQSTPHFVPGVYRFKLVTFVGKNLQTPQPTFAASLELHRRGGC